MAMRRKKPKTPSDKNATPINANSPAEPIEMAAEPQPVEAVAPTHSEHRNLLKDERLERVAAAEAERRESYANLSIIGDYLQASTGGNIMDAVVAGVFCDKENAYWQCIDGPITIRIPYEETFDLLPAALKDQTENNVITRRTQLLKKSINCPIKFIITKFERDPRNAGRAIVYGSRTKAMAKIRQSYFGDNAIRPLEVGDLVDAQFMSIGPHVAWVTFRGVDVSVKVPDLTHRYITNMTGVYRPGDKVKVMVKKIAIDPSTSIPSVRISGRTVELEDCKSRYGLVPPGSTYAATIVNKKATVNRTGNTVITNSLWIERVDVPAFSNTQAILSETFVPGDKVYVKVIGVADSGYIHCKIVGLAGEMI